MDGTTVITPNIENFTTLHPLILGTDDHSSFKLFRIERQMFAFMNRETRGNSRQIAPQYLHSSTFSDWSRLCPAYGLKGLRNIKKDLAQESWCSGWDSKQAPQKQESWTLSVPQPVQWVRASWWVSSAPNQNGRTNTSHVEFYQVLNNKYYCSPRWRSPFIVFQLVDLAEVTDGLQRFLIINLTTHWCNQLFH